MPKADIVDAHHHIWRKEDLAWLTGPIVPRIFGRYEALQRDYLIDEYLDDLRESGVIGSVYVQTNWTPGESGVREVSWVQSVADASGWPHAIVGFADLSGARVEHELEEMSAAPRLRGIRQQVHWHENPQYRFAARPDIIAGESWRAGLSKLAPRGLLFELQVFTSQMDLAADLVEAFPETTFVLEHAGMLEDLSTQGVANWRDGLRKLAAAPNVYVKLSGLGTFVRRADLAGMRPIIRDTVDIFGSDRCVWGSNFPIEKMWTSYRALTDIVRQAVVDFAISDQRRILAETAIRLYRLNL